ncbi:MAG: CHAT domain-containing tetratricopeptide repeat protein [Chloroflexota bacterium]|nr:CHAT domain-containing tetratricopeptide repeat protein [Chloroflexota bacterium]
MDTRLAVDWFAALATTQRRTARAAALLETFTIAALNNLVDHDTTTDVEAWCATGVAQQDKLTYQLLNPYLAVTRASLANDPDMELEGRYMQYVRQLCEPLIRMGSSTLCNVLHATTPELLQVPEHCHLYRYYQGLCEGFQTHYEEAHLIFQELLTKADLDLELRARILNSNAVFARYQGNHQAALDNFTESLLVARTLGNIAREALALMNIGMLHFHLHDYKQARRTLDASQELFVQQNDVVRQAHVLANLGLVACYQGGWDEALQYMNTAAATLRDEGDHEYLGYIMLNLGELAMLRGEFATAWNHYTQANDLMETDHYRTDVFLGRGLLQEAQGDNASALTEYGRAREIAIRTKRKEILAWIHARIGHVYQRQGVYQLAKKFLAKAIAWIELLRRPINNQDLLISLMSRWQVVYEQMIVLSVHQEAYADAFNYAERARARAFADLLAKHGSTPPHTAKLEPVTLHEAQQQLPAGTLLLAYYTTGVGTPETELFKAMPPAAASLKECLSARSQVIWMSITNNHLHAKPCSIGPEAYYSPYQHDGKRFLNQSFLRVAYNELLAPSRMEIADAQHIVIIPHGPLHHVPFAALRDPRNRPFFELVDRLTFAPSATIFFRGQRSTSAKTVSPCLTVGYAGAAEQRLRHTEAEAAAVAQICQGTVWNQQRTPAATLGTIAGQYRILHFACHGHFDLDDPLQSYLEIGPGHILRAADILHTFTLHADLVTLSACVSGVSRVLHGDEPLGLVRAFLAAGAQAVLVTLWPVEDCSARMLIEHFYTQLQDDATSGDAATALRMAQHYLRTLSASEVQDWLRRNNATTDLDIDSNETPPFATDDFWAPYQLVSVAESTSTSI